MVALPAVVVVKLAVAIPFLAATVEPGLNEPARPVAVKLTGLVAVLTVLP
jgi:hypothetical protein